MKKDAFTIVASNIVREQSNRLSKQLVSRVERQAGGKTVAYAGIRTLDLPIPHQKHYPLGYQPCYCFYAAIVFISAPALLRSESNRDHSKMKNESVKKSLEKSKKVLEEKR